MTSDRQQREEALRRRMHELSLQFLTRTEGEVSRLKAIVEVPVADGAALEPVIQLAHKICGTASTFQFDDISARAAALEQAAGALASSPGLDAPRLQPLVILVAQLAQAVAHSRRAATP